MTITLYGSIQFNSQFATVHEILLAYCLGATVNRCYSKGIVKSRSILSQVSVNKLVNKCLNRENLFSKHQTDMKGVCDTLCMARL